MNNTQNTDIEALKAAVSEELGIRPNLEYRPEVLQALLRVMPIAYNTKVTGKGYLIEGEGPEYDDYAFTYYMTTYPLGEQDDLDMASAVIITFGLDGSWHVEARMFDDSPIILTGSTVCYPNAQGIDEATALEDARKVIAETWRQYYELNCLTLNTPKQ